MEQEGVARAKLSLEAQAAAEARLLEARAEAKQAALQAAEARQETCAQLASLDAVGSNASPMHTKPSSQRAGRAGHRLGYQPLPVHPLSTPEKDLSDLELLKA